MPLLRSKAKIDASVGACPIFVLNDVFVVISYTKTSENAIIL